MWWTEQRGVIRMRGKRVRLQPRWLADGNQHAADAVRYDSLLHFVRERQPGSIALRRTFALGDLLLLWPIARALHRHTGCTITIITRRDYALALGQVEADGIRVVRDRGKGVDYGACVHLCLNAALQADHRGGWESDHHRCWLYAHALGYTQGCAYQEAA